LFEEFKNEITELINNLELIGKGNLKFLAMKLDYNYYYSEREIENIHKKQQQRFDNYEDDDDEVEGNYEDQQIENENSESRGIIRVNISRSNKYHSDDEIQQNLNNYEQQFSQGDQEEEPTIQNQNILNQTSNLNYSINNSHHRNKVQDIVSDSSRRFDMKDFMDESQNNNQPQRGYSQDDDPNEDGQ
jgi:hypothetical protein